MLSLVTVSFLWALSFSLIGVFLPGVDPVLVTWVRLALASLVLLPFVRWQKVPADLRARLLGLGAIQFGLTYVLYLSAFRFLGDRGWLVALFTVTTPVFVALLSAAEGRRFPWLALGCAALAVLGAGLINWRNDAWGDFAIGFALMQASNLCFAWGQLEYRRLKPRFGAAREHEVFALPLLGGWAAAMAFALPNNAFGGLAAVTPAGWWTLLYLGVVASGAGFFLWNHGAAQARPAELAVANNLKVPLAVAVGILFFQQLPAAELDGQFTLRLAIGGTLLMAAQVLAIRWPGGK